MTSRKFAHFLTRLPCHAVTKFYPAPPPPDVTNPYHYENYSVNPHSVTRKKQGWFNDAEGPEKDKRLKRRSFSSQICSFMTSCFRVFCFGFAFVIVDGGADCAGYNYCFPAEDVGGASATAEFFGLWTISSAGIASSFRLSFAGVFVHTLKKIIFCFIFFNVILQIFCSFLLSALHPLEIFLQ